MIRKGITLRRTGRRLLTLLAASLLVSGILGVTGHVSGASAGSVGHAKPKIRFAIPAMSV